MEAERLQREEERLGAQADDLDKEVVDMEWHKTLLERRIADIEKTQAEYLRENADTESSINMYRAVTMCRRDQEAGLRRNAKSKKGEAERLREQAGRDCMSGIDH